MSYFAVAYPKMLEPDYAWVQAVRRVYDTNYYGMVEPHFTMVFGTDKLPLDGFIKHVESVAKTILAFDVSLREAEVIENDFKQSYQCFLIPDEGYKQIKNMHDALYSGSLESELRHDIPYIPHISIGNNIDKSEMDQLSAGINKEQKIISGRIDAITILEFDGKSVSNLRTIPLLPAI